MPAFARAQLLGLRLVQQDVGLREVVREPLLSATIADLPPPGASRPRAGELTLLIKVDQAISAALKGVTGFPFSEIVAQVPIPTFAPRQDGPTQVSVELAVLGVRSFVPKWRPAIDESENYILPGAL